MLRGAAVMDDVVESENIVFRRRRMVGDTYILHDWDPSFRVCNLLQG